MSGSWQSEYITLIEDCENRDSLLSDWERNFISSIKAQIETNNMPTHKQIEKLDSIWERVTGRG